jgi:glyoxylase-like metal-dependent hydrolase (beta-lactamase superfamily II)
MEIETIVVGALETNCYLVYDSNTREAAVIDPGAEPKKITHAVAELDLKPVMLINTHGHVDHIGANKQIKDTYSIPLLIHSGDKKILSNALQSAFAFMLGAKKSPAPDKFIEDGDVLNIGDSQLNVSHTPGHSPGGIILISDTFIVSGDTLFNQGVGRADLPGGDWDQLMISIKSKIITLDENLMVFPGHGPPTTVGREKNSNPHIQ